MQDMLHLRYMATAYQTFADASQDNAAHTSRLLITVATYNEIENLPELVAQILEQVPSADLLVIDDNSPDGTGKWCDEYAKRDPRLHCLHRSGKLGLGTATVAGMKHAIEHGYELLINMDADFSHHPRYLPAMLEAAQDADVVIGSRYVAGGGVKDWPLKRRLMSKAVNFYARWMLGLTPNDCSGAFRCIRIERLAKVDLNNIRSRGYSFQEEILWLLKRAGATFAEVPILFEDRLRGVTKINSKEAWAALRIILRLGITQWTGI